MELILDGVNDYLTPSSVVNLVSGDVVTVTYTSQADFSANTQYILDGNDAADRAYLFVSNGNIDFNSGKFSQVLVDGVSRLAGQSIANDGLEHTIELTVSASCKIGTVGARYNAIEFSGCRLYYPEHKNLRCAWYTRRG